MKHLNYEKIMDALVGDGYIVIEHAFGTKMASDLLQSAQEFCADFKVAGISSSSTQQLDKRRRSDKTLWLESTNASEYLQEMDALRTELNRGLYLGLSYYEAHFARYDKGNFYEKHRDAFKGSKNRVVTTVYYLNDAWQEADGGELIIYDDADSFLTKVTPNADTLVIFLSEKFPHEVLPANAKRHSIAGWLRVDKI